MELQIRKMITVLLPVKNGEKYIKEAIDSVLNQTFQDFELLIFNDESVDGTLDIINAYAAADSRIKVITSQAGFIGNLNAGIEAAKGAYIARMDADDRMIPDRLKTQLNIMKSTDTDICGSWVKIFGDVPFEYLSHFEFTGRIDNPLQFLSYTNFLAHSSVMMRRSFMLQHGLRYENYPCNEDYKLWFEVAKKNGVFYVEPQPLMYYRISKDQVTKKSDAEMKKYAAVVTAQVVDYINIHSL